MAYFNDIYITMHPLRHNSHKRNVLEVSKVHLKTLKFLTEKNFQKNVEKSPKNRKITIFVFLINRPIWPILMIYKLHKMSLGFFDPNLAYWSHNPTIRQKIAFFGLRCPKMDFSHKWKNRFLAEISAKLEYSRKKIISEKTYTPSGYLPYILY